MTASNHCPAVRPIARTARATRRHPLLSLQPWVLLALGATLLLSLPAARAGEPVKVDRSAPADANATVTVSNVAGAVRVTGWDKPEVHVGGRLGGGVQRLDVTGQGARIDVKVVLPRASLTLGNGDADLEVSVPAGARVVVSTVSADIAVDRVAGELNLRSVSGEVEARFDAQPVEIKSVSGDIRLQGNSKPARLRIASVSGDVQLDGAAGSVESVSVSGDTRAKLGELESLRIRSTSGDVQASGAIARNGSFEIESVSGDVRLGVTGAGGFTAEAEAFSGDITTCYGERAAHDDDGTPNAHLTTRRGEGAGRVRIKTMSGDVRLCDR